MRRMHLFEFEDFNWLPKVIRNGGTDFLNFWFGKIRFYTGVSSQLSALLKTSGIKKVTDLCSGGGGGTLDIVKLIMTEHPNVKFSFTDQNPNEAAMRRILELKNKNLAYLNEPLNAMEVKGNPETLITMSGALHHFTPDDIKTLLSRITDQGVSLAFFDVAPLEVLRRIPIILAPIVILVNMAILTFISLLIMPAILPYRFSRIFFTYFIPAIPFLIAWDGTISVIRAYRPEEILSISKSLPKGDSYNWDAGVAGNALYLTGIMKKI